MGLGRRYPTAFCIYMEARLRMGIGPGGREDSGRCLRTQGGLLEVKKQKRETEKEVLTC